jgi:hypothetical protein
VYEEQARNKKQNLCELDFKNKFRPRRRYHELIKRGLKLVNRQIRMAQEMEETRELTWRTSTTTASMAVAGTLGAKLLPLNSVLWTALRITTHSLPR